MFYTDAHLHLIDDTELARAVNAGVGAFAVNATRPADWDAVARLATRNDKVIPCFGIHPWCVADATTDWAQRLSDLLAQYPTAAVGEIGLDKTKPLYDTQLSVFTTCLNIAETLNRPAIVHCVKAWDKMIPVLRQSAVPCLLHRFNGSAEIVRQLAGAPVFFSVPDDKRLAFIPREKLLLESDAPDGPVAPADIPTLAQKAGLNKEQLYRTFQLFFRF